MSTRAEAIRARARDFSLSLFSSLCQRILNVLSHQGQAGAVIFTTRVISYVNIKSVCSFKVKEDQGLIVIGATIYCH